MRERVLEVLWTKGGMTADQVAERLRLDALSVRPRVSELLRLGLVRRSGERRRTRLGKLAAVVEAVPA
jgi:predicted ArsR family transcriptional regulator